MRPYQIGQRRFSSPDSSHARQAQKQLAAKVISTIRPIIVDAVEQAGGTGYRAYLEEYAQGMQQINQTKLGGKLLDLFKNSPEKFVKIVEGNNPEEVAFIAANGRKWYEENATMDAHVNVIKKVMNLDKLK